MLKTIKKILGIESDNKGNQVDFSNAWNVHKINDKNKFLSKIIELVPANSIWSIEGLYNESIENIINKHIITDDTKVWKATAWPRQNFLKVNLTVEAKRDILAALPTWDLDCSIIHQHIYKDDKFYLTSFDNLDLACTWISKDISKSELDKLKEDNIIDFRLENE